MTFTTDPYFAWQKTGKQTTLKKPFIIKGCSFFNNQPITIIGWPARANLGLNFLYRGHFIKVEPQNIKPTQLHTSQLSSGDETIIATEHILSALYGLGVDNAILEYKNSNQSPLLDGSAKIYTNRIIEAGIKPLPVARKELKVIKPLAIKDRASESFMILMPSESLKIKALINFSHNAIGAREKLIDLKNYQKEIAPARTFFTQSYTPNRYRKLRKVFQSLPANYQKSPILIHQHRQFISRLRFADEPLRHKILDFCGDLALLDCRLIAEIIVYRPGHRFTQLAVKEIANLMANDFS